MAWSWICRPTCFGGLGVKDLHIQALALHVRWEWLHRSDQLRPWQGLPPLNDDKARQVSDGLVHICLGDVRLVLFWRDRWINGMSIADFAPLVLEKVNIIDHRLPRGVVVEIHKIDS